MGKKQGKKKDNKKVTFPGNDEVHLPAKEIFNSLINIKEFQVFQNALAKAFGVALIIIDPEGNPITKPSNFSTLCRNIIRKTKKGLANCMLSDAFTGRLNPDEPVVQLCPCSGLRVGGVSLMLEDRHIGNWIICQVRDDSIDDKAVKAYARKIGADEKKFRSALARVPVMPEDQFSRICSAIFLFAKSISHLALKSQEQNVEICRRRKAEEELLEEKHFSETVMNSLPGLFYIIDKEGKFLRWNKNFETVTGYTSEEFASMNSIELIEEIARDKAMKPFKEVFKKGESFMQNNIIQKNGKTVPYYFTGLRTMIDKTPHLIGMAIDITERIKVEKRIQQQNLELISANEEVEAANEEFKAMNDELIASQQELIESEEKFRTVIDQSPISIDISGPDGYLVQVNKAWEKMWQMKAEDMVGKFNVLTDPQLKESPVYELIKKSYAGENIFIEEFYYDPSGSGIPGRDRYTRVYIYPIKNIKGDITNVVHMCEDITEQKLAIEALRESEEKYRSLYDNALMGMFTIRLSDGLIIEANEVTYKMFGYSIKDEVVKRIKSNEIFIDPDDRKNVFRELKETGFLEGREIQFKRKDSSIFWGRATLRFNKDSDEMDGIVVDVNREKEAEDRIVKLTLYDKLTELPKKGMFKNYLEMETARSQRLAVICLGIDRFKDINDIHGRSVGDRVIRQIALKLQEVYFKKDMVSHFEGDKFMILLSEIGRPEEVMKIDDIEKIVQKTHGIFSSPFKMDDSSLVITASMGICLYPTDGKNAETLIKNCESAMDVAKQRGRNTSFFFDAKLNNEMKSRITMESEMRLAINNNEIVTYYQPKVDVNGKFTGMEALIRWRSPKRKGLIPPIEFIPLAEKNGMIVDIGYYILGKACEDNRKWQDMGYDPIPVSVNLSPYQFRQRDLISAIRNIIIETGLDPRWLELEITESGIMENEEDSIAKLKEIHDLGISISIDDFGSGYSSLSKLKSYPIDTLKIDKSFIDDLPHDRRSTMIAITIIDLAHNLGFNVVAEGVEKKEQFSFLQEHDCDQFQGYYFHKPLSHAAFERKLKKNDL